MQKRKTESSVSLTFLMAPALRATAVPVARMARWPWLSQGFMIIFARIARRSARNLFHRICLGN